MKTPAFQFYVNEFITGTMYFSAEETGGYIRFLCYQWDHGFLPNNDKALIRISGLSKKNLPIVKAKFILQADGTLINQRLEKERVKQLEWRNKSSEAGKKSAEIRRNQSGNQNL